MLLTRRAFHMPFLSLPALTTQKSITGEKKNQFLHLHDISAPSWEMEFINQGQISLCLALGKRNEGEKGRRKWKCGGEVEGSKEKGFWRRERGLERPG